jgi:SAM-dependent methyltransferase
VLVERVRQRVVAQLVRQAGRPHGVLGRAMEWLMAHRKANRQRNVWVVSRLDLRPTDRALEIGFGPGLAIAELARHVPRGRVVGVDHSAVMVRQASRRNAAAIRAGRVHLVHASVDGLPPFGEPFDVVLAVNSIGFWPEPVRHLAELRGRLRPGGRIALASEPRCPGATAETTARAAEELGDQLARAGFTEVRVELLALTPPVACVLAVNPGAG